MSSVTRPTPAAPPTKKEKKGSPTHIRGRSAFGRLRRALGTIAGMLFVVSLVKELRTPKEERAWHGTLLGFVPYDLRLPTPARVKEVYWNTESHQVFSGRLLGVGWAVNFYEVVARVRGLIGRAPAPAAT